MMRTLKILMILSLALLSFNAFAQSETRKRDTVVLGREMAPKDSSRTPRFKTHLIAPKGEWQCGLSVMYADFSSNNSDYMLLLQGLDANASILRLAPEAAYTFRENHAIGARFQYTNIGGMLDSATADLLGNLSLSVEDITAQTHSMGGSVYQRTYQGLDKYGRIGIFWDYILGFTRSKTQFGIAQDDPSYSINNRINLGFAPGLVYFPMNNVSVQACISLAGLSYNRTRIYSDGQFSGVRHAWKAYSNLSILDLNFGITVHL